MGNLSGESREQNCKDKVTRFRSVTYARQLGLLVNTLGSHLKCLDINQLTHTLQFPRNAWRLTKRKRCVQQLCGAVHTISLFPSELLAVNALWPRDKKHNRVQSQQETNRLCLKSCHSCIFIEYPLRLAISEITTIVVLVTFIRYCLFQVYDPLYMSNTNLGKILLYKSSYQLNTKHLQYII